MSWVRRLVRFIVHGRSRHCPQVILYIFAVLRFQIGGSLDVGIRTNYLLKKRNQESEKSVAPFRGVLGLANLNTMVQFENEFRAFVLMA